MTEDTHTQCDLIKDNVKYTAWIPTNKAVVGKIIKLKSEEYEDTWEEGWEVVQTYTTRPSKEVADRAQDYKRTRKASDI